MTEAKRNELFDELLREEVREMFLHFEDIRANAFDRFKELHADYLPEEMDGNVEDTMRECVEFALSEFFANE